ncbi:MAG: T9SS type A sorting domain-containing protein [Bacteroidota bacterium]
MRIQLTLFIFAFIFSTQLTAQKAPNFKITTTDSESIDLYQTYLNEGTTVVIELFFVNCPPCRQFAPFMSTLYKDMQEREIAVEFISLSVVANDNDDNVNEFKTDFEHDWPFAHYGGGSREAAQPYQDGTFGTYFGTPTIVVISPDGTVNYDTRALGNNAQWIANIEQAILDSQTPVNDMEMEEEIPPVVRPMAKVTGGISTTQGDGLSGVSVAFSGAKDTVLTTNADGTFETANLIADTSYTITLAKNDDHVNGVTTLDIVLISKHILGIDTFTMAHQHLAADANGSGSVTTFDLVQLRQLILGKIDEFPTGKSWLFDPESQFLGALTDLQTLQFTAIKMGDLNGSASTGGLHQSEDRTAAKKIELLVDNQNFKSGETIRIPFYSSQSSNLQGLQFALDFDPEVLQLEGLHDELSTTFSANNFSFLQKDKGYILTSWNTEEKITEAALFELTFTALRDGELTDILSVNQSLMKAEAYDFQLATYGINLSVNPEPIFTEIDVELFPNPVVNTAHLTLNNDEKITWEITVFGVNGQIVKQQKVIGSKGLQTLQINMTDFPSGIYTVQLASENQVNRTLRLVKQ